MIEDVYNVRNSVFHEGSDTLTSDERGIRRQQIRDLVSLIMVEMLQSLSAPEKQMIAIRMQNYR